MRLFGVDISASASASEAAAAAADPSLLVGEYDVFLSFCGQDTRHGFIDFLFISLCDVGIRTFRDNEGLHVGEEIGRELLKTIKDSKIFIPVFSKNYAASKWCLLELAHMVQCQKNEGQIIFPIFYDVDPCDVRNQSGSYEEAFRQHKKRRNDDKVIQGWKEALKKVGQLKGLELKKETGGHQGELAKIIRDKVLEFLKHNNKHEDLDLVGMPNRIEKMEELLNIRFDGVRFIGIHGMGGLGKTTIAKVIYNKYQPHFDYHSYLNDVRETSKSRNGIVHLQNQLCSDIFKRKISDIDDYKEGIRKIKEAVHEKNVLIVLDDVNEESQIDRLAGSWKWFGARARIIITTRNEDVLCKFEYTCHRDGHPEVYRSYKPDLLDNDDSLELFSKYAFMNKSPPEGYDILSKNVVSTAAGLPLVLVVTGSSLYGETDKELWEEKFKELKNIPAEEVQEKLRLSFDPLSGPQKEIFLDIACLFIGMDKTNPCYMWDDCGLYPKNALKILVRRSLITVGDDGILRMHDQLRDLGRQIACEGKWDEGGSRLWDEDKAFEVYSTGQGTENVKALCLNLFSFHFDRAYDFVTRGGLVPENYGYGFLNPRRLVGEKFVRLQHLRYLTLYPMDALYGDFEHCLPNLRWLQWRYCFLKFTPTNLHLRNLVILDLSSSYITEDSDLWSQIQMSKKLKVLDLSNCKYLWRVPFLSTFSNLERLVVNGCGKLLCLDGIEKLESLRYLDATGRDKLLCLDGIEELESLRYLDATGCDRLKTLPNLSRLTKLKELKVDYCELITDIPGLDKLESLELLSMLPCKSLERLPDLSNLKWLKKLFVWHVKLTEIRGLGGLKSLEVLVMSECIYIERVFGLMNLKRLRRLYIPFCIKLIEIHGLEGLESLESLNMNDCNSIKTLPALSKLKSLKTLSFENCKKLTEIQGLEELKSLKYLNIGNCKSIENLTDFSNHGKLKVINAAGCEKLTEIQGLENLESFGNLFIYGCKSLNTRMHFEVSRIRIHTDFDAEYDDTRGSTGMRKLEVINAAGCEKLTEIRGLENLESFGNLFMCRCESLNTLMYFEVSRIRIHTDFDAEYYEFLHYLTSRWYEL